jgi:Spy/CpxP family protein refolding chaperone
MKSIRYRLLIAAMAVLLGSAIARSQTADAPPPHPMHGHHAGMQGHEMGFFAQQLNLTDEQKTQMKTVMESAHTTMKPLRQQSHQIDQQLHQYAMGKPMGKDEEGAVQQLASQKATIEAQLIVAQTKIHNQMFQLLTPDQQTKAKEMVANHEARMQKHMQQAPPAAPEQ